MHEPGGLLYEAPEGPDLLADLAEPVTPRGPDACECCPDLPPSECIDDPAPLDPGEPEPGADCDCGNDGDFHPPGSGGCVVELPDVPDEVLGQPIEDAEMPPYPLGEAMRLTEQAVARIFGVPPHLMNDSGRGDLGVQHGPFWVPWRTWEGPAARPVIALPGVYELADDDYHDPTVTGDWVSNSDLRAMSAPHCPAKWKHRRDMGVKDKRDAFEFGKAAHRSVLGVGSTVVVRPAEWDSWRKPAAQKWKAEQQAAGRVVVTPEDATVIEDMAAAMLANPKAVELLGQPGIRAEVALFWVERLPSGRMVKRRAMVDGLPPHPGPGVVMRLPDYKTADSACPDESLERKIYDNGYHRQAESYPSAVVALGLADWCEVVFVFQEKHPPYLVTPVDLDAIAQEVGEIENRQALEVYVDCLESGIWPGYADDVVTLSIPYFRARQYEEQMK